MVNLRINQAKGLGGMEWWQVEVTKSHVLREVTPFLKSAHKWYTWSPCNHNGPSITLVFYFYSTSF